MNRVFTSYLTVKAPIILGVILVLGLIVQQSFLNSMLSFKPVYCGGDWNYEVKCPFGSYCTNNPNSNPLEGGKCSPYIFK